jgi:site-specific DNA-methyltransferase (adenine-specific)
VNNELERFSEIEHALAEASTIEGVKRIRDDMETLHTYFRKVYKGNLKIQNKAALYKLRAARKLGEMIPEQFPRGRPEKRSHRDTFSDLGISKMQSHRWQQIAELGEDELARWWEETDGHEKETTEAAYLRHVRTKLSHKKKTTIPDDLPDHGERWALHACDALNAPIGDESVDWIITDPPYPREHIQCFYSLSTLAARVLKPGGSVVVMCGQSFLPDVIDALSKHLSYQWVLAYLTPGGQSAQLWDRKVNTFWKPLLWFTKGKYTGDWIGDVCNSTENDKQYHKWGQSVGGMAAIIERFTVPGELICDPFCGAGTTGVAAIKMNRLFVGVDIDSEAITTAKGRLAGL